MEMKALLYYGQRDIRLSSVTIPEPQQNEVLIRVTGAGLCQTQLNEFIEGPFLINSKTFSSGNLQRPIVVGHEFGGVVEKSGSRQNEALVGKQVAVLPLLSCGRCPACAQGMENMCEALSYYGLLGADGGFAEYACIRAENVYPVKDAASVTFIEPALIALHAARKIAEYAGMKKICILGAGPIGICTAAIFRDFLNGNVTLCEPLSGRLGRARQAGFNVCTPSELNEKYDVVVDCAGNTASMEKTALTEGLRYLKGQGILLLIGTYFHPISIIPSLLQVYEQKIVTSYLYDLSDISLLGAVLAALQVDFSTFNHSIRLENIIEDGYYRAEVDTDSFTRLVVVP